MLERGEIGFTLADALLAEYDRRVQNETLYGFLPSLTFIVKKMNQRLTGTKTNQLKKGNAVRSDACSHLPDGTFLRIWPIKVAE